MACRRHSLLLGSLALVLRRCRRRQDLTFAFVFLSWCQFINNLKFFFLSFGFFILLANFRFRNGVPFFSAISSVLFFWEFSNSFASYWFSSLYPSLLSSSLFSSSLFCSSSHLSSSKISSPLSFANERFYFALRTFTNGNNQLR